MKIASFSTKNFVISSEKTVTFDGMEHSSSIETEETENGTEKPKVSFKAKKLDSVNFTVILDYRNGVNPQAEKDEWNAIKDAGKAYYLIVGNNTVTANKMMLTEVSASDMTFSDTGSLMKCSLKLSFTESYVKKKKKTAKSTRKK